MENLLSTKEVAEFINVNEKMVYSLVSEKGLPATKITGKWLFPKHLVEQWIEANTINYPDSGIQLPSYDGLLIITGSNDPLLDRAISLFNSHYPDQVAVFGNLGSMGGLSALRKNFCHIASSHLLQENESEYNFDFAIKELDQMPAVVNFCRREQGILVQKGNPNAVSDGAVAAMMARSAGLAAICNVRINLPSVKDADFVEKITRKIERLEKELVNREKEILGGLLS